MFKMLPVMFICCYMHFWVPKYDLLSKNIKRCTSDFGLSMAYKKSVRKGTMTSNL